ncbi:M23 family metallopeptidase [uncultured Tateyamaria sp.]|uniref:M23 family metallopeptidase n=1 Tax=uncultured Tateyamaria sp. TaxID=455651 RepID=UPI00261D0DC3|nr:M23 family metallopeptidase [uncultured Tateyamaria sp.]
MHTGAIASLCLALAATPLAARDILLTTPILCDLSTECFVQQYVDHDASDAAMDYRCAPLSYDTHSGTDFALTSRAQMRRGVDVRPAAPGTVRGVRDGMVDEVFSPDQTEALAGRDCGNGVAIDHGGGWSTQYCHLKQGSVSVQPGDRVRLNTVLGQVGLSGRTQFPHLHMTLRKDGQVVDPFDPDGQITCGAPSEKTLWQTPPPYRPGGILRVGFADAIPDFETVMDGDVTTTLPVTAPTLVLFGYAFGGRAGDRMQLRIDGPQGPVLDQTLTLDKDQAQFFRAAGKKRRGDWRHGTYTGTVTLIRNGAVLGSEQGTVTIP